MIFNTFLTGERQMGMNLCVNRNLLMLLKLVGYLECQLRMFNIVSFFVLCSSKQLDIKMFTAFDQVHFECSGQKKGKENLDILEVLHGIGIVDGAA